MWNVELIGDGPGSTIAGVLDKSLQLTDPVQVHILSGLSTQLEFG